VCHAVLQDLAFLHFLSALTPSLRLRPVRGVAQEAQGRYGFPSEAARMSSRCLDGLFLASELYLRTLRPELLGMLICDSRRMPWTPSCCAGK
jgi:hypothetical protein